MSSPLEGASRVSPMEKDYHSPAGRLADARLRIRAKAVE
jgi:hypothetical protein